MSSKAKKFQPKSQSDDHNPAFTFGMTDFSILAGIIRGELDPVEMAKKEMANRGCDLSGNWIGFDKAEKLYNVKIK